MKGASYHPVCRIGVPSSEVSPVITTEVFRFLNGTGRDFIASSRIPRKYKQGGFPNLAVFTPRELFEEDEKCVRTDTCGKTSYGKFVTMKDFLTRAEAIGFRSVPPWLIVRAGVLTNAGVAKILFCPVRKGSEYHLFCFETDKGVVTMAALRSATMVVYTSMHIALMDGGC